jgi:hypothetical protein
MMTVALTAVILQSGLSIRVLLLVFAVRIFFLEKRGSEKNIPQANYDHENGNTGSHQSL